MTDRILTSHAVTEYRNAINSLVVEGGHNGPVTKRRGSSIIATAESRSNAAYGLLTTPDRVQALEVPAGGILEVTFDAQWKESVDGAARAAVFIGANQLTVRDTAQASPVTSAAPWGIGGGQVDKYAALVSCEIGLVSSGPYGAGANPAPDPVTTGMALGTIHRRYNSDAAMPIVELGGSLVPVAWGDDALTGSPALVYLTTLLGGSLRVFGLPAGSYDVSVQFKASSGSVTAKNRKLWCWTLGF